MLQNTTATKAEKFSNPNDQMANSFWPTSVTCKCGTEEQTADHIMLSCPIYELPTEGLKKLDDNIIFKGSFTFAHPFDNQLYPNKEEAENFIPDASFYCF